MAALSSEVVDGVQEALEQAVLTPNRLADTVVVDNFCSWLQGLVRGDEQLESDAGAGGGTTLTTRRGMEAWTPALTALLRPVQTPDIPAAGMATPTATAALGGDHADRLDRDGGGATTTRDDDLNLSQHDATPTAPDTNIAPCCNAPTQGSAMHLGVGVFAVIAASTHSAENVVAEFSLDLERIWATATAKGTLQTGGRTGPGFPVGSPIVVDHRGPALRLLQLLARDRSAAESMARFEPLLHEMILLFCDASLHVAALAREFTVTAITTSGWILSEEAITTLTRFQAQEVSKFVFERPHAVCGIDATNCFLTLLQDVFDYGDRARETDRAVRFFMQSRAVAAALTLANSGDRVIRSKAVRVVKRAVETQWLTPTSRVDVLNSAISVARKLAVAAIEGRSATALDAVVPLCAALLSASVEHGPANAAFLHGIVVAPFGSFLADCRAPSTATPPDPADPSVALLLCVDRLRTLFDSNAGYRKRGMLAMVSMMDTYRLPPTTMAVAASGIMDALGVDGIGTQLAVQMLRALPEACRHSSPALPDLLLRSIKVCTAVIDLGVDLASWCAAQVVITAAFETLVTLLRRHDAVATSLDDTTLRVIADAVHRRMLDSRWEVRDAAISFCSALIENVESAGVPHVVNTFLHNSWAVAEAIWAATTADEAPYVRSSAWLFWQRLLLLPSVEHIELQHAWSAGGTPTHDVLVAALRVAFQDTEAEVRRAALDLCIGICSVEHSAAPDSARPLVMDIFSPGLMRCTAADCRQVTVLDTGIAALIIDFDWEVKLRVLKILRSHLGLGQDGVGRPCPACFVAMNGAQLLREALDDYDRLVTVEACDILQCFALLGDAGQQFGQVVKLIESVHLPELEAVAWDERTLRCVPWLDILVDPHIVAAAAEPLVFTDDADDPANAVGCY